jgi:N-acetyltransferase
VSISWQPLDGGHVRLELLAAAHVPGLVAAAAADPDLYRWSPVPQGFDETARYVQTALRWYRDGTAVPLAVVRRADGEVIGSTRFWDIERWPWPAGHRFDGRDGPDVCEIGYTWLAASAVRTAANTEMKRLMLGVAFEQWQVHRVCFHTDVRNTASRLALERIGARFEGVLRAHRMAADLTLRDSARFSVLAAEWPAVRDRLDSYRR